MAEGNSPERTRSIIAESSQPGHGDADRPLTAVVLAGGKAKPEFTAATGVANRALVTLTPDNRTMLDLVVAALQDAAQVQRIFVVGDVPQPNAPGAKPVTVLAPGDSLIDNIFVGFDAAKLLPDERVLLASADIPFITGAAVDDYVAASLASGAEFCYPIVPMDVYRREYGATMKRTTLRLREGEFTGGNIMLMRAGAIAGNPDPIRAAYDRRKSPIALGGLLGWGLLGRILASQIAFPKLLTIPLLEKAVGRVLGGSGSGSRPVDARAIVTPHASIGTDIDSGEDVTEARRILGNLSGTHPAFQATVLGGKEI